jgi:hypothetical protein
MGKKTERILLLSYLLTLFGSAVNLSDSQVDEISVYPSRVLLYGHKARQTLAVTAKYSNGTLRDVTAQSRFESSQPDVIEVDPNGVVSALALGKAKLQVTFDKSKALALVEVGKGSAEVGISFVSDIAPILTQKGCAGSNCHGSIRGKGDFKLSLFNSHPDLDYREILENEEGRRVNLKDVERSLILQKPTFGIPHGGGERFQVGAPEYVTIKEWLSQKAPYDSGTAPRLLKIEVFPKERILVGQGSKQRLIVTGFYSDGSERDLTRKVQYSSSDESIISVDEVGGVTTRRKGETAVMARILGKAAVAKMAVIDQPPLSAYPAVATNNFIDEIVFEKLRRLNIIPSELSEDSIFIRRVFLDTLGVLPTPEETRSFLSSRAPQKRSLLIDELLRRPEFSEFWTMKLADLFQVGWATGVKGGQQMFRWLRQSLRENKLYDRLVRELLLGTGPFVYSPTANFNVGLMEGPEGMATQISQALLGIRLECSKCHDHPFERWTQDDFYGLAAFFARLERKAEPYGEFEHTVAIRPSHKPTYDFLGNKELKNPKSGSLVAPKFLDGPVLQEAEGEDPREKLAEWLTDPSNPWFSRAIVNRIWKHYLGRGIVEGVDDFRVTNPPSNEKLLDALADYFINASFDMRKLVKLILNSRTYQLSATSNPTNADDQINYSRFYLKRMMSEVLFDAMGQAAGVRLKIPGYPLNEKAISVAVGVPNYFLRTFGRTEFRDVICERDHQPTVAQAMHLVNGDTIQELVTKPSNIIDRVEQTPGWSNEQRITEIYLATFSRFPTREELDKVQNMVAAAELPQRKAIYQDLLWAIFNSKEFGYIH